MRSERQRTLIVLSLACLIVLTACGSSTDSSTPGVGLVLRVRDSTGSSRTYNGSAALVAGPYNLGSGLYGFDFVATDNAVQPDTVRRVTVTVAQLGLDSLTGSRTYAINPSGSGAGAAAGLTLIPGFASWAADSGTITLTALDSGDLEAELRVRMARESDPSQQPLRVRATLVASPSAP